MEGTHHDFVSASTDDLHELLSHGICTRFGECEGEDVLGSSVGLLNDVGDAEGENRGLTSTRACNHHNRPLNSVYGLFLGFIETFVESFEGGVGHMGIL